MEEGEDGHLDAEKQGWDADFQIGVSDFARRLDYIQCCRGEDTDQEGLPEGEEDHQLDGDNFQERMVGGEIHSKLDVELDEAVHGHCDRGTLNDEDLTWLAEK